MTSKPPPVDTTPGQICAEHDMWTWGISVHPLSSSAFRYHTYKDPSHFHCKEGALTEYRSRLAWQPGYYHDMQALQSEFYSMLFYNVLKLINSDAPTTTTTNWTNWTWGRLCRTAACPLARQRKKQCCFVYYHRFKFAVIYELFHVAKMQKWLLYGFKWLDVTTGWPGSDLGWPQLGNEMKFFD